MERGSDAGMYPLRKVHVLARKGWLSALPTSFQQRLGSLGRWMTYPARTSLCDVSDEANALFGLEKGLPDLSLPVTKQDTVTLHRAQAGFWIGDAALLAEVPRTIRVDTVVESLLFVVPGRSLRIHLEEHPEDMRFLFRLSHANAMLALDVLAETFSLTPRMRFARLPLRLANEDGLVPATQTEIGKLTGMSRAAFRRAFDDLIRARIVETTYAGVRIPDKTALEAEAALPRG